jgi:hypothetical protein
VTESEEDEGLARKPRANNRIFGVKRGFFEYAVDAGNPFGMMTLPSRPLEWKRNIGFTQKSPMFLKMARLVICGPPETAQLDRISVNMG